MEKVKAGEAGMTTPNDDERMKPIGRALGNAIQVIVLKENALSFSEVVREYKRVEEDFVAHPDGNAFHVLETRRRIAESILVAAHRFEQSLPVCQDAWNELVGLGFTNMASKCTMTWFYTDCCLLEEQFDVGLAVLDPLIAELEASLTDPACSEQVQKFNRGKLEPLYKIRDELKAGIRK